MNIALRLLFQVYPYAGRSRPVQGDDLYYVMLHLVYEYEGRYILAFSVPPKNGLWYPEHQALAGRTKYARISTANRMGHVSNEDEDAVPTTHQVLVRARELVAPVSRFGSTDISEVLPPHLYICWGL